MVEFLVMQIKLGKLTVDKVPAKYKDEVLEKLNK
jgi:hypothetical protein